MENNKQAPRLKHEGVKRNVNSKVTYQIPQDLCTAIFNGLSGKNGNAIKLMIVLLGNIGNGTFRVSEKFIKDSTGMEKKSYQRARKELINLGWITHETGKDGTITVLINKILGTEESTNPKSEQDNNPRSQHEPQEESTNPVREVIKSKTRSHDEGYNKEVINKNREVIDSDATLNEANASTNQPTFLTDLSKKTIHTVWDLFKEGKKYNDIIKETGIKRNLIKPLIDYGKENNFKTPSDLEEELKPIPLTPAEQEHFGSFMDDDKYSEMVDEVFRRRAAKREEQDRIREEKRKADELSIHEKMFA